MRRRYPDGPKINLAMAVVGQIFPSLSQDDPLAFGLDVARKYGDIAHFRLGPVHIYQIQHPELVRQVVAEQSAKFYKPRLLKRVFPRLREGLLLSDGAVWKRQRKLIQPAFQHQHLAQYGEVMAGQALRASDSFAAGETYDAGAEMAKVTMRIVVKCLFGTELVADAEAIGPAMVTAIEVINDRLNAVLRAPAWVPTRANRDANRTMKRLDAIIGGVIATRRSTVADGHDLLSVLLAARDEETGVGMSDSQLRDEVMTLFLAGYETTANALTWTWYLLARHPEVEARLWEELDHVLAGRPPAVSDLRSLPYNEMVIREALRLYPPAPVFGREPIENVTVGGYEIPKGSLVLVNTYAMHHDGRFFPEPERFHPERFAAGWEDRIPKYAWVPFGGGPRVCIGNGFAMMEARLVLATLAQRWRMVMDSAREIAPKQVVTLRPERPVRMVFERRKHAQYAAAAHGHAGDHRP